MKLEQSFEVDAPLERVWQTLIDVEHVAPCLPGAAVTGRNDDGSYNGTFTVKIGPTTASYTGRLEMENVDEASHTATMQAQGTDKRGQGGAKATILSRLAPVDGHDGTRVEVVTDYHITGRLARFGRGGMIEDISERLLREFAKRLQTLAGLAVRAGRVSSGRAGGARSGDPADAGPARTGGPGSGRAGGSGSGRTGGLGSARTDGPGSDHETVAGAARSGDRSARGCAAGARGGGGGHGGCAGPRGRHADLADAGSAAAARAARLIGRRGSGAAATAATEPGTAARRYAATVSRGAWTPDRWAWSGTAAATRAERAAPGAVARRRRRVGPGQAQSGASSRCRRRGRVAALGAPSAPPARIALNRPAGPESLTPESPRPELLAPRLARPRLARAPTDVQSCHSARGQPAVAGYSSRDMREMTRPRRCAQRQVMQVRDRRTQSICVQGRARREMSGRAARRSRPPGGPPRVRWD